MQSHHPESNTPYRLAGSARLPEQDFPTFFMVYTLETGETLQLADLEQEYCIQLSLMDLRIERQELGKTVVLHAWSGGREVGRLVLAEGNLAPGVRVFLYRIESGQRSCTYYLQPGWDLRITPLENGQAGLRFFRREPAGSGQAGPKARHRHSGPRGMTEAEKTAIANGWRQADPGESQEAYCNRVGVSTSTLRHWIRELEAKKV
jgi:hypothetical protein